MLRLITLFASLWVAALVLLSEPVQFDAASPPEFNTAPSASLPKPAMFRPNGADLDAVREWSRQPPRLLWHALPYNPDEGAVAAPRQAIPINFPLRQR